MERAGELDLKLKHAREDFPMLSKTMHGKPLVYLDTAATAQKPNAVIDAIDDFYREHYGTVHRAVYELSTLSTLNYQKTREKVRDFIHAKEAHEIIFTRGTTESINLVAYSFGKTFIKPGDEILISEIEHHSNIVPWQIMAEDRGAILRVAPVNDLGELDLDAFKKMLNEKTKLVSIAHISNALGTIHPVKEIISLSHKAGAKVLIDGAQACGHLPIDVQDLDADFYVFSGHKLYGPTGIGILYGKEALLEAMPPYQGGGDMIQSVTFQKTTYNVLPLKFEAGTPMIAEVIGLGQSIDYVSKIGLEAISEHEKKLLEMATKELIAIPFLRIIGQAREKAGIISFVHDKAHSLDIGTLLDLKGVAIRTGHHCAQPAMKRFNVESTARASFGLYNTPEEIHYFINSLKDTLRLLS